MHNLSAVVLAWQQDLTTALPGNGSVSRPGRRRPASVNQVVLALLLLLSVVSWAIIIQKSWAYRMAERHTRAFLQAFRRSAKFAEVQAACPAMPDSPLVGVFQAGYAEITAQLRPAGGRRRGQPAAAEEPDRGRSRAAARLGARGQQAREEGDVPGHDRQRGALHRPVRHGVGHHGRLPPDRRHRLDQPLGDRPRHLGRRSSPPRRGSSPPSRRSSSTTTSRPRRRRWRRKSTTSRSSS